jgi:hypothetical protein
MPAAMSAVEGKADFACQELSGPFLAKKRHLVFNDWQLSRKFGRENSDLATHHFGHESSQIRPAAIFHTSNK